MSEGIPEGYISPRQAADKMHRPYEWLRRRLQPGHKDAPPFITWETASKPRYAIGPMPAFIEWAAKHGVTV